MSADHTATESPDTAEPHPPGRQLDWWHRDHPTFTALSGFFTGLVFVCLVPGVYLTVLDTMFSTETVEDLFPLVLVALAVPAVLLALPRTRRFGGYMLIGMVVTLIVVLGVGWLVLWVLLRTQS
ncbi:hypothetical protein [Nocardioides sp.]|uniref:hypothetical protein n=1 Tax=Nocardioides sp. TaxID=35761 RepID=UPI002733DA01|nr:hypothetical protein [Nocardioides sp.]MDP3893915.1 hypothetical protein [Nocardioides sp.]